MHAMLQKRMNEKTIKQIKRLFYSAGKNAERATESRSKAG
jgi:hypothetical protein